MKDPQRLPTVLNLDQFPDPDSLTPLQRRIASLVREGRFRHDIQNTLGISSALMDAEIRTIYATLEINDLLSLAFYAHYHDLSPLSQSSEESRERLAKTRARPREALPRQPFGGHEQSEVRAYLLDLYAFLMQTSLKQSCAFLFPIVLASWPA